MKEDIAHLRKEMDTLRTEFRELKQTHLDVNRRYSESLITLRGLTLHATESAEKAASAAEHSASCSERCLEAAAKAASTHVTEAAEAAAAHHAEDASAQGSAVAADASKNAASFAAKAVMLSNKAAEFARSARNHTG
ncbi:MAG: hypothetical protein RL163_2593 [Pseudomonadota bacterium]